MIISDFFKSFILVAFLLPLLSCQNEKDIIGTFKVEKFSNSHHSSWYAAEYDTYEVDMASLEGLQEVLGDMDIQVYLGTWCSDSQRELPRFIKILEALSYDQNRLTLMGLDREKKSPEFKNEQGDIEYVPTFIFFRNGQELGRIIESPIQSLEKDLRQIILGT